MKHLFITYLLCLLVGVAVAQVPQSLNYQGVARNQQGNVLANKTIGVQLAILNDNNEVYRETHKATTNAFGLFTLQVGQGTVATGNFATIDWNIGLKAMKVGIDPTGGSSYLDMGTSPLLTVPFAMVASKALNVVDQSLSGLKDVDTAGKVQGYVLGWDGTKWKPLSGVAQQGWLMNNGDLSNVNPTGKIGLGVTAPKAKLHLEGSDKEKILAFKGDKFISNRSTGSDYGVTTSGEGLYLTSETGNYKQAYYFTQGNPLDTTPIFGITSKTGTSAWSPALNVSQQGMVGIGVTKPKAKLHVQNGGLLLQGDQGDVDFKGDGSVLLWNPGKAAFRAGYASAKSWDKDSIGKGSFSAGIATKATGMYSTAMGSNTISSEEASTALGAHTKALGSYSTAMGYRSYASGMISTAMGSQTRASGNYATSIGENTEALGQSSTAMGSRTRATGTNSTALGFVTQAIGDHSTAMGSGTVTKAYGSTVVGISNDISDVNANGTMFVGENRIFQIGNGNFSENKNAMTVLYSGAIGLGVVAPQKNLSVAKDMNIDQLNTNTGTLSNGLTFGSNSGEGIASKRNSGDGQNGLDFYTNFTKRISVSNAGNTTILGNLTVRDSLKATIDFSGKAFVLNGDAGTTTLSGDGTRLMWIPAKRAFRAGEALNNSWDINAIGDYSFASGHGTKASGLFSTAVGSQTVANGDYSFASGANNTSSGDYSAAFGSYTIASGRNSIAMGENNTTASGRNSMAVGDAAKATGFNAFAFGSSLTASGSQSAAFGMFTSASGTRSVAMGDNVKAKVANSLCIGAYNDTTSLTQVFTIGNGNANTNRKNAFSIDNSGNAIVQNTITVKNNKGIVRSSDGTQQKKVTTTVSVNASFAAGENKNFPFTFPENFSATPDAYVGNIVSGSGNWGEALMVINNLTATGGTLYVFNAKGAAVANNFVVKIIAIGAE